MDHGWISKLTQYLHKQGAKTPLTPNPLRAPHPQITENLHHLQKLHQNLGYFNPKTDLGDPISTDG